MICEKCECYFETKNKYSSGRFCSRSCANSKTWSNEHRKKLSESLKKSSKVFIRKTRQMIIKCCPICNVSYEVKFWQRNLKKYCSDNCARKRPNQGGFRKNSTRKTRSIYKGFQMDSGAERKFAEMLDDNNIKWIKNSTKYYHYIDNKGKKRKYYPDFFLIDYDYWVEIKGKYYYTDNDELKLKSVGSNIELQFHNNLKIPNCCL